MKTYMHRHLIWVSLGKSTIIFGCKTTIIKPELNHCPNKRPIYWENANRVLFGTFLAIIVF